MEATIAALTPLCDPDVLAACRRLAATDGQHFVDQAIAVIGNARLTPAAEAHLERTMEEFVAGQCAGVRASGANEQETLAYALACTIAIATRIQEVQRAEREIARGAAVN